LHEWSIATGIVESLASFQNERKVKIRKVEVGVGQLSGIEAGILRYALETLGETEEVAGLILNMAYIADSHQVVMPFGKYNLQELERKIGVKVIAELPLEPEIASSTPINMAKLSSEFQKGLGNIYRAVRE